MYVCMYYALLLPSGRVSFDGSDMSQAIFANAVLSGQVTVCCILCDPERLINMFILILILLIAGTTFANANLKDTDFSDAYLGEGDSIPIL